MSSNQTATHEGGGLRPWSRCTEFENEVTLTIVRLAGEKRHPPMSTADLLGCLERAGVERFAAHVRSTVSRIPIPGPENDSPSE